MHGLLSGVLGQGRGAGRDRAQLAAVQTLEDEIRRLGARRDGGKGEFRAAQVAVAAGGAHVVEAGVGQTADVAAAVTAEDDHHGLFHHAADGDPLEAVHTGEEVGHGHQQVGAVHLVEPDHGPAPAVAQGAERAGEKGQPGAQVLAADDAAQQGGVGMLDEPLVGAQVVLAAGTLEGGGIRADAVEQRRGEQRPGLDAQALQVAGHHGAGGTETGTDVAEGRLRQLARREGMMVDDEVEGDALERRVVVGLGVHHGEIGVEIGLFGLPELGRDAQVADHGQVVGPGDFVDAEDVHTAHTMRHDALERQRRGQGVRVRRDEDGPALILGQCLPPLSHLRYIGIGHDRFTPLFWRCGGRAGSRGTRYPAGWPAGRAGGAGIPPPPASGRSPADDGSSRADDRPVAVPDAAGLP